VGWMCECGERLNISGKPRSSAQIEGVSRNRRSNLRSGSCGSCGLTYELAGSALRRAEETHDPEVLFQAAAI
jgi:hypothetical protein